jgi:DNA-directed RNA polymerase specialized sigma24 family protein
LVLRFAEEFSIKETAYIMKKNINNVKVIQKRALEKLRQVLTAQENDER